jgi:hypothetical protein
VHVRRAADDDEIGTVDEFLARFRDRHHLDLVADRQASPIASAIKWVLP